MNEEKEKEKEKEAEKVPMDEIKAETGTGLAIGILKTELELLRKDYEKLYIHLMNARRYLGLALGTPDLDEKLAHKITKLLKDIYELSQTRLDAGAAELKVPKGTLKSVVGLEGDASVEEA